MHASCYSHLPFVGHTQPAELEGVPGVYVFLGDEGTKPLYVGQTVGLRKRVRVQFGLEGPGKRDSVMNKLAGLTSADHRELTRDAGTTERANRYRAIHKPLQPGVQVAVICFPDVPLDRLECDLWNWLKPPHTHKVELRAQYWDLDTLEERIQPYMGLLEAATGTEITVPFRRDSNYLNSGTLPCHPWWEELPATG